jgi:CDP-diacylglycerol---serine O-phosphatidyltransferase
VNTVASPLAAVHPGNTLTYAALLSGMGAVAAALNASTSSAAALIALAVIFDTFDGRFAKLFARSDDQRAIGVQIDSLSDAIVFGLVPVVCFWILQVREWSWSLAFVGPAYVACAITRLAFYNVTHGQHAGFIGLPAPVAALIWCTTAVLDSHLALTHAALYVGAAAMILPLPVIRPRGIGLLVFACWPVLVICTAWAG